MCGIISINNYLDGMSRRDYARAVSAVKARVERIQDDQVLWVVEDS